ERLTPLEIEGCITNHRLRCRRRLPNLAGCRLNRVRRSVEFVRRLLFIAFDGYAGHDRGLDSLPHVVLMAGEVSARDLHTLVASSDHVNKGLDVNGALVVIAANSKRRGSAQLAICPLPCGKFRGEWPEYLVLIE